jgi:chromosome segregation ATPase
MLDAIFKNGSGRRQAQDDFRTLVDDAREERTALTAVLAQLNGASAQLVHTSEALDNLGHKADGMAQKIEKLAGMALAYDKRVETFAQLEKRMGELLNQVAEAKRVSEKLTAPDGELHQHRQAAELMGSQAREAQATLSALRQEGEKLDQLHTKLRASTAEMAQATDGVASLKSELETLRSSQSGLRQEMQDARESARVARADSTAAVQDVNEMHGKLESFAQLQELSRSTEKRLASLNALAEHVAHKTKALEAQKPVEHAVVEATRLNEMVWTMDAQLAKLAAGNEQMQRTEEAVARMEEMAQTTTQELVAATAARDEFLRESARLEAKGLSLSEHLKATIESVAGKERDRRLRSAHQGVVAGRGRVGSSHAGGACQGRVAVGDATADRRARQDLCRDDGASGRLGAQAERSRLVG